MISRIFAFDVLAPSGLYQGWAHTREEMEAKFHDQVGDEPCEVWFTGGAPTCLTYEEYHRLVSKGYNQEVIRLYDARLRELLDEE